MCGQRILDETPLTTPWRSAAYMNIEGRRIVQAMWVDWEDRYSDRG